MQRAALKQVPLDHAACALTQGVILGIDGQRAIDKLHPDAFRTRNWVVPFLHTLIQQRTLLIQLLRAAPSRIDIINIGDVNLPQTNYPFYL